MASARSTSPPKSAWPGVSTMWSAARPEWPRSVPCLRVEPLARLEHGDEPCQPLGTGLGLLGVLEPVGDRVAVLAVELGEERLGLRTGVELSLEVVRDGA